MEFNWFYMGFCSGNRGCKLHKFIAIHLCILGMVQPVAGKRLPRGEDSEIFIKRPVLLTHFRSLFCQGLCEQPWTSWQFQKISGETRNPQQFLRPSNLPLDHWRKLPIALKCFFYPSCSLKMNRSPTFHQAFVWEEI